MQQLAQASLKVASALSLALSCAGCLVTNELDFDPSRSQLTVKIDSPESPYPVPEQGSDDCPLPGYLFFRAEYYYEDVEQALTVLPLVNGAPLQLAGTVEAKPDPQGTAYHVPPPICVKLDTLNLPCNRVELFVSADPDQLRRSFDEFSIDPRVQSVVWLLTGRSGETPGSTAKPYTSFSDCLPRDATP
jgi:hypothetical protein